MKNYMQLCLLALILMTYQSMFASAVPCQQGTTNKEKIRQSSPNRKKVFRKKKRGQKKLKVDWSWFFPSIIVVGLLIFVLGLLLKIFALWLIGLCLAGIALLTYLILLVVLIGGMS